MINIKKISNKFPSACDQCEQQSHKGCPVIFFLSRNTIYEFSYTNIGFLSFVEICIFSIKEIYAVSILSRQIEEKTMPFPTNCKNVLWHQIFSFQHRSSIVMRLGIVNLTFNSLCIARNFWHILCDFLLTVMRFAPQMKSLEVRELSEL